ncbi:Allantoinase [Escherichia coli ISC41]|nr:Allantoinase [Escherichia coli ISC41]
MSFDLIIKNGTVILENEARVVDIAVKDGKNCCYRPGSGRCKRRYGCVWSGGFAGHG